MPPINQEIVYKGLPGKAKTLFGGTAQMKILHSWKFVQLQRQDLVAAIGFLIKRIASSYAYVFKLDIIDSLHGIEIHLIIP